MPELPEVETMRLQLKKFLTGHKIVSVEVRNRKTFQGDEKLLVNSKIIDVRRFGKVSVIDISNGYSILTHVKLTGQYIYRGPNLKNPGILSKKVTGGVPGPHTLVIFNLDKNGVLYYNDVRRFGWIRIEKTEDVSNEKFIVKLGPEPFKDLTLPIFKQILSKSSRPIKIVLMDQAKMGGVGNIYATDALWLSKINPKQKANMINEEKVKELYDAVLSVLEMGLKYGGASELAFVTPDGAEGEYQNHTLAYGHTGEPCERCHKAIFEKYFLGGRGTYWCPNCQK
jgi:formamidopyrimidine-DNA glycosylase